MPPVRITDDQFPGAVGLPSQYFDCSGLDLSRFALWSAHRGLEACIKQSDVTDDHTPLHFALESRCLTDKIVQDPANMLAANDGFPGRRHKGRPGLYNAITASTSPLFTFSTNRLGQSSSLRADIPLLLPVRSRAGLLFDAPQARAVIV